MKQALKVGIIGDFNSAWPYHKATNDALSHAAGSLSIAVQCSWLPTPSLDEMGSESVLDQFDALWCSPGSPYQSMEGALKGIRFARERGRPFIGT
ncbi:MAG: hypothetical protein HY782_16800 [Chloroflexi bacterium]|nr:hypothetical protein [Chloroflexota bacterium]